MVLFLHTPKLHRGAITVPATSAPALHTPPYPPGLLSSNIIFKLLIFSVRHTWYEEVWENYCHCSWDCYGLLGNYHKLTFLRKTVELSSLDYLICSTYVWEGYCLLFINTMSVDWTDGRKGRWMREEGTCRRGVYLHGVVDYVFVCVGYFNGFLSNRDKLQ